MNERRTIMAVGAHVGDAQLTSGLLLAKHALRGDKVVVVDLTAGERGAPPGVPVAEFRGRNVESAAQFARLLGGESIVLDIPDGELTYEQPIALALCDLMRAQRVDAVLCHWKKSMHKDHEAAHLITRDAIFYASLPTFERPLPPAPIRTTLYAENWEDAEDFVPDKYFDVTDAFALWKQAVCKLWLTENSRDFQYLRYYDALSVMRGALIRKERATAFAIEAHARRRVGDFA